jgi:hypothetical protein
MIRMIILKWAGQESRMGTKRNACTVFVVKPEGRKQLRRLERRWRDNIKIDLREMAWGCMNWIHQAWGRDQWRALVNTVMNLRVP